MFTKYRHRLYPGSDVGAVMARRHVLGEDLSAVSIAEHVKPGDEGMIGYNVHGGSESELHFFAMDYFRHEHGEPRE